MNEWTYCVSLYQRVASSPFHDLNAIFVTDSLGPFIFCFFPQPNKAFLFFTPGLFTLPLQFPDPKCWSFSLLFQPSQKFAPLFSTSSHAFQNDFSLHHLPVCTTLSWISPISPSTSGGFFTWQVYVPLSSNCSFQRRMETSYRSGFPSQTTRSLKRPLMGLKGSTW